VAQQIVSTLVDDITGKEIPAGDGETIQFTYQGTAYQIDLDTKNAAKYHAAMDLYVSHAQKLGRASSVTPLRRTAKNADIDTHAVRSWAESNGYEVSARGRIKGEIVEAFRAAMA
jgi:hypothetical protein